jgi:hypothetical protein
METLVIYAREGRIKCVPDSKSWIINDLLIEQGWKPVKLIDPDTVIEYLHNDCPEEDLYNEIKELGVRG